METRKQKYEFEYEKYTVSVSFVINFHRLFNYGDYFGIYTQTNETLNNLTIGHQPKAWKIWLRYRRIHLALLVTLKDFHLDSLAD